MGTDRPREQGRPAPGLNRYQWTLVALGSLVFMTNYIDKTVIGVLAPHLTASLHITKLELGVVFSAFALTYTILQPVLAWIADLQGPRRTVAGMVAWYGIWTVLSGVLAGSLAGLTVARAMTGAGEAASMPATTGGIARWVPKERRALAQGLMHAATRIGAALTVPVTVALLVGFGVSGPFWVFGIMTLVVGALWLIVYRDPQHEGPRTQRSRASLGIWRAMLRSRSLWALCLADFCYFYTLTIYLTWLPSFLINARHFTLVKVGIYGLLPFLGGMAGGVVGGLLCDVLGARSGRHAFWRRMIPTLGMVVSVALLIPAVYSGSQMTTIVLFSLSFFFLDATIAVFWAIAMDLGGGYASTVAGWMNTWANVGGIVSPLVFGALVQVSGSWTLPFMVASGLMLIGAALVWLIDPDATLTIEVPGEPASSPLHTHAPGRLHTP